MKTAEIALVIPAYNEQGSLPLLLDGFLNRNQRLGSIVVVDDGSTDATAAAVRLPGITLIKHETNLGKARALIDGMTRALDGGAAFVATVDADGQHRPQDLDSLLTVAAAHPDALVIGARLADRESFPTARYRANCFANFWIGWAAGQRVCDSQSGFRVYPAALLRRVLPRLQKRYPIGPGSRRKGFVFDSELLIEAAHLGYRPIPVPIPAIYNTERASHFRPVADFVQIGFMVASHLIRRGLYPLGLVRSLRATPSWNLSRQPVTQKMQARI
jgi:glycosyltransferase involved in cell wall biosynthesis